MKSNILILFCCFLFLASCQASFIEEYTLLPHPVDIKYIPGMVKLKTHRHLFIRVNWQMKHYCSNVTCLLISLSRPH